MKDTKNQLGTAIEEYGPSLGISKKDSKKVPTGEIEFPEDIHALRAIRDALIEVGDILEEKLDAGIYIAAVKAGSGDANPALVVALVEGSKCSLAACAREGLIKQSTAKKAIEKIKKAAHKYIYTHETAVKTL